LSKVKRGENYYKAECSYLFINNKRPIWPLTMLYNKMISYRRETALQGAL